MEGTHVNYLGRVVPVHGFRAFIYGSDGGVRLVNSWESYETHISTGVWFGTKEMAIASADKQKPRRVKKTELTLELTNDDFLPNESA